MATTWTTDELRASVTTYARLHVAARDGVPMNKAQAYRDLAAIYGRSPSAYERRMMNISHVVKTLGGKPVQGLLPAANIGTNVLPMLTYLVKEAGIVELPMTVETAELWRAQA